MVFCQQIKNIPCAGRPSDPPTTHNLSTGSVRRASKAISRRNSVDDNASSLSLENLGGSQDNLSLLGRNPDKEMRIHTGRRSTAGLSSQQPINPNTTNQTASETLIHDQIIQQTTPNNDRYLDNREVEEMERRQRESMSPLKSQYVRLSGKTIRHIRFGGKKISSNGALSKKHLFFCATFFISVCENTKWNILF